MNELWVARDGNGVAWIYSTQPKWIEGTRRFTASSCGRIYDGKFQSILPGQCRRLVMESEASE
jgi:hypothetical protein